MHTVAAPPTRAVSPQETAERVLASIRNYAIFTLDPEGNVTSWHPGAERLKGYREAAIVGRHVRLFYPQEAQEAGEPERVLAEAARGACETEGWRVRQDGSAFWASVVVNPLRNGSGALVGFAKVTRDLSERRRAERQALHLARAEERLHVRDAFLEDARRELCGGLAALRVHLRTLTTTTAAQPGDSEKAIRQKVTLLQWGLDRLSDSVHRVLAVAREASDRLDEPSMRPEEQTR